MTGTHCSAVNIERTIGCRLWHWVQFNRPNLISLLPGQLMNHSPLVSCDARSRAVRSARSSRAAFPDVTATVAGPSNS